MEIDRYLQYNNVCTLYISNIRRNKKVNNCINLMKKYIDDREIYFEIYMVDCINLNTKEFEEANNLVSQYLEKYTLIEIKKKSSARKTLANQIISAFGKIQIDNNMYEILPKIFDYYLETSIFKPKVSYEIFSNEMRKDKMEELSYYINKGYSDLSFAYVDSGDFIICFNTEVYNEDKLIADLNAELNN